MPEKRKTASTRRLYKPAVMKPTKTAGKMLAIEVIYSEPNKKSAFVGATMVGDAVTILDATLQTEGWIKIQTENTKVIGYVNSNSVL